MRLITSTNEDIDIQDLPLYSILMHRPIGNELCSSFTCTAYLHSADYVPFLCCTSSAVLICTSLLHILICSDHVPHLCQTSSRALDIIASNAHSLYRVFVLDVIGCHVGVQVVSMIITYQEKILFTYFGSNCSTSNTNIKLIKFQGNAH